MTRTMTGKFANAIPGMALCASLGVIAYALGLVGPVPVMMLALVFGLLLSPLRTRPALAPGVQWGSRSLLYIGVALLGLRIDPGDLSQVSPAASVFVLAALFATLAFGCLISKLFKESREFGFIMSGAVAVCGVAAAAAICAAMPDSRSRDRELAITIAAITALSTVAMLLYPLIATALSLAPADAGLFIGGSVHNVSQAVGAGYSLSPETGDITVIFKLLRVSALLLVMLLVTYISGTVSTLQNPTLAKKIRSFFPRFLVVFTVLAALNCFGIIPSAIASAGAQAANWCLIISLVAIGMKTNLREVLTHGRKPLLIMTLTTVFMAAFLLLEIKLTNFV